MSNPPTPLVSTAAALAALDRTDAPPPDAPLDLFLLLDSSGSMTSYARLVEDAVARLVADQSRAAGAPLRLSLTTFSTSPFPRLSRVPTTSALSHPLRLHCAGGTALWDALHSTLSFALDAIEGRCIFAVATDGLDTDSTSHDVSACATLIDRARARGWTVLFFGLTPSTHRLADQLGIPSAHRLLLSSPALTAPALDRLSRSLTTHRSLPPTSPFGLLGS